MPLYKKEEKKERWRIIREGGCISLLCTAYKRICRHFEQKLRKGDRREKRIKESSRF